MTSSDALCNIFLTMKDFLSRQEVKYIKRRLAHKIRSFLNRFSVIVISGARQVGKTTMLKNEFSDFAYYTLDDFDTIELLKTDPMFIFDKHDFIVIDEAQKMPEIFNTIKIVADNYKNKRVIISGSSNMLLMKNISESLCGRAAYFELLPMTLGEKKDITNPTNLSHLLNNTIKEETINELEVSIYELLIRGFMPENMLSNDLVSISVWMESYIKTYLERDLRQLSQIESLIDFRRLKKVLALRVGNILNQAEIARETGISTATTYRYIKLLEVSNIIELLGSFFYK